MRWDCDMIGCACAGVLVTLVLALSLIADALQWGR